MAEKRDCTEFVENNLYINLFRWKIILLKMSTKNFKGLQSQVNIEETKKTKNKTTKHHKEWATHSTLKAQHWSMQLLAKLRFWYPS